MISRRRRREFSGSSSGQVVVASAVVVDFRWRIRVFAPNGWWETGKGNCISMSGWPFISDQSKDLQIKKKVKFGPESSLIKKCFWLCLSCWLIIRLNGPRKIKYTKYCQGNNLRQGKVKCIGSTSFKSFYQRYAGSTSSTKKCWDCDT